MMGVLVFFLILFYFSIVLAEAYLVFHSYKRALIVAGFVALAGSFIYFNPLNLYKLDTLKTRKLTGHRQL